MLVYLNIMEKTSKSDVTAGTTSVVWTISTPHLSSTIKLYRFLFQTTPGTADHERRNVVRLSLFSNLFLLLAIMKDQRRKKFTIDLQDVRNENRRLAVDRPKIVSTLVMITIIHYSHCLIKCNIQWFIWFSLLFSEHLDLLIKCVQQDSSLIVLYS